MAQVNEAMMSSLQNVDMLALCSSHDDRRGSGPEVPATPHFRHRDTSKAALPDPEAARSRFHSGKRAGGNCTEGQYCIASPGLSGATLNRFAGPKRVNSESLRRPAAGQHTEIRRFAGPQRGNTEVLL